MVLFLIEKIRMRSEKLHIVYKNHLDTVVVNDTIKLIVEIKDDKEVKTTIFTLDFNRKKTEFIFSVSKIALSNRAGPVFFKHARSFFQKIVKTPQPGFPGARKFASVIFAAKWL